ncbi:putative cell wall binding repeat protein [Frigoribacterium sp. PhB160]|uniref:cell wall-binding repeat-containing protein n=1 Tax=Frigoribacterium sp. PhB160 TaxID=2485192 RepID=UPI000F4968F8|nr:cell wall-binding repeat-containing protein [Frigoribacterium sp. PhB160]ROS59222.1 putative cell wall binding repeat protein [Frigoribacterium sp. PhB160]
MRSRNPRTPLRRSTLTAGITLTAALVAGFATPASAAEGSASAGTPTDAAAASTTLPKGNLNGWRQVLTDDFATPVAKGSFPGPYAKQWMTYDGFGDTWGIGQYDKDILSVHDSVLDLHLHTAADGRPRAAAPIPLVDGKWGGQVYGRYSVRMKADQLKGYGTAFLLWDDENNWSNGEINFPEGSLDGKTNAFNHVIGNPQNNDLAVGTGKTYADWHTYTIDWKPGSITYLLDGAVVAKTTTNVPTTPMHWVLQTATDGSTPAKDVSGHLQIDWVTQYAYDTKATAPSSPAPAPTTPAPSPTPTTKPTPKPSPSPTPTPAPTTPAPAPTTPAPAPAPAPTTPAPSPSPTPGPVVDRVSGSDRYASSVAISKAAYPGKANVVYVVTGEKYPDALSAGPAAVHEGGPVLLTKANSLPSVVAAEIRRLSPKRIVVVGGPASVSDRVVSELKKIQRNTVRIGGSSRYETSRNVAAYAFGKSGSWAAFVATGENFPDALSAGSAAGAHDAPVLLVRGSSSTVDAASTKTLKDLGVSSVAVVGGPVAVSTGAESTLRRSFDTQRIGGSNRYVVSAGINALAFDDADRVFLATGTKAPDALSGTGWTGTLPAPLFTVKPTCVPAEVLKQIRELGATKVTLIGGPASLTSDVSKLKRC